MIYDPLGNEKTLRNSDEVVQKLIELRDDLWRCREVLSYPETMITFRINSCLYEREES